MKGKKKLKIDFIGIGGAKCGSSWIAKCLSEHPQIFIPENNKYRDEEGRPLKKELLWFKDNIINCRDFENFFSLPSRYDKEGIFPYLKFFNSAKEDQVKGEISTVYMYDSSVASKIKKEFPDVKILAYLRNPIERTFSHFYFSKYTAEEDSSKTFEEAIKKYPAVYINTSLYYKCLKPYFDLFPRENILVLIYEDIKKDPLKFIQNIYKFLGVDDTFVPPSLDKKVNPTVKPVHPHFLKVYSHTLRILRKMGIGSLIDILKKTKVKNLTDPIKAKEVIKRPPMKPETRKYLQQIFAEDIENLEKLIDRDLSFWR